jgi:WD40 repeat protein
VGCHGERVSLGGYRAHTFQSFTRAGASRKPVVVAGKAAASRLYQLITAKGAARMPKNDDPLSAEQVALVRRWIDEGARFDGADPGAALGSLLGPRQHPAAPAAYRMPVPVLSLALSPGGKELLTGGYYEVNVWNPATGALVRRLQHLPQRIQSLTYARDGKQLLVAGGTPGEYGEVALVDPASGKRTRVLDTFPDLVLAATFSQDGKLVAAGGADAGVRVYEAATGRRLWSSKVHSDWVTGVSFSPDGRFLASSSKDMTVKIYEVRDGSLFTTYNGHNRNYGKYKGQFPVYAVRFTGEQLLACSAGGGKVVQLWDPIKARQENGTAADMEERFAKESHARYIEHGFSKDVFALQVRGGQLFAASADGTVKQLNLAAQKVVHTYAGFSDWVFGLDFDPASHLVAAGSYGGEVRVWNTETGEPVLTFQAQPGLLKVHAADPRRSALR